MEIHSLQIPFREALHIFKVSIVFVSWSVDGMFEFQY